MTRGLRFPCRGTPAGFVPADLVVPAISVVTVSKWGDFLATAEVLGGMRSEIRLPCLGMSGDGCTASKASLPPKASVDFPGECAKERFVESKGADWGLIPLPSFAFGSGSIAVGLIGFSGSLVP